MSATYADLIRRLGKRQRAALDLCAIGRWPDVAAPMLRNLVDKGLLDRIETPLRDRLGSYHSVHFEMPIHVHIEWARGCSREVTS